MEPDELYTLRTTFWLGHYNMALEEAKNLARRPMAPHLKAEREEFLHRANIALGRYSSVAVESSASTALRVLGLTAKYHTESTDEGKAAVLNNLEAILAEDGNASSSCQLYAAQLFLLASKITQALQCVHLGMTMEHLALSCFIYVKIDRLDLANDSLQLMKQADEDAALTLLSSALIQTKQGKSMAEDAIYSLQMLSEQYGPSPLILNQMAAAHMAAGKFESAAGYLQEATLVNSDAPIVDTLLNQVVCFANLNNTDQMLEIIQNLKLNYSNYPQVKEMIQVEAAFDRVAAQYSSS